MTEPPVLLLALRLARRELRSGLRGFGVFLACLFLGVFAISAIGSFSAAAKAGLLADASALLGGDLEIRRMHRPFSEQQRSFFAGQGETSEISELRTMAGNPKKELRALVELKAVDAGYPLYGQLQIEPPQALNQALAQQGALVETALLQRLDLQIGDRIQIGEISLRISGVLKAEPDRDVRPFYLGPRVMISSQNLAATGLIRPGSMVTYRSRLRLADPNQAEEVISALQQEYPQAGWRLRTWRKAAPRVRMVLDRLGTNLTLLGLCALLIGGLGVAGAVARLSGRQGDAHCDAEMSRRIQPGHLQRLPATDPVSWQRWCRSGSHLRGGSPLSARLQYG